MMGMNDNNKDLMLYWLLCHAIKKIKAIKTMLLIIPEGKFKE